MSNCKLINETNKLFVVRQLKILCEEGGSLHCTNGGYAHPASEVIPLAIAGFQFVTDRFVANPKDIFLVAVNSDDSMHKIYEKNGTPGIRRESMYIRAGKLTGTLATQFSGRTIVFAFHDEETPRDLFEFLNSSGLPLPTLHKWGYGADPLHPHKIEGAHCFGKTLALTKPGLKKPFAYDLTPEETQPGLIRPFDLSRETGSHDATYFSQDGELLLPLAPSVQKYLDTPAAHRPATPPTPN